MHELAVTQSILDIAIEAACKASAQRILAIDLVIGDLSSIVDDSVQFYFDMISQGTPAEGARLVFHRQPATLECRDCGGRFEAAAPLDPVCPACGGVNLKVEGGRDFYVQSIEVDGAQPEHPAEAVSP